MFISEHIESKLLGEAQLNYCVVLANGLAEPCPGTFRAAKILEILSRCFENVR